MSDDSDDKFLESLRDDPRLRETVKQLAKLEVAEQVFASSPSYRAALESLYQLLSQPDQFSPGDFVMWKPGLKNKTYPLEDTVAVVIEHLSEPFYDTEKTSGSAYYREPLDLALGVIVTSGSDRQFVIYWFDSRRFHRSNGSETEAIAVSSP